MRAWGDSRVTSGPCYCCQHVFTAKDDPPTRGQWTTPRNYATITEFQVHKGTGHICAGPRADIGRPRAPYLLCPPRDILSAFRRTRPLVASSIPHGVRWEGRVVFYWRTMSAFTCFHWCATSRERNSLLVAQHSVQFHQPTQHPLLTRQSIPPPLHRFSGTADGSAASP